ncbi:MAG: type III-A CRISPR-associated RAMP protein Csm5 [Planctomycetes bacterium]|nr:type III-A CRISPR-associated RAMP protein Csm5 [Planctomycetota bacterium]
MTTKAALHTTLEYRMTCLTPVHVGTGKALAPSEYVIVGSNYYRIDPRKLAEVSSQASMAFKKMNMPLEEFLSNPFNTYEDFFQAMRVPPKSISTYYCPTDTEGIARGEEVREQQKDIFQRPVIPGSSIKGALTTAILGYLERLEKFQAEDEDPLRRLIHARGHHDLLAHYLGQSGVSDRENLSRVTRAIRVSDASATDASRMSLVHTVLLRQGQPDGSYRGHVFKKRDRSVRDPFDADGTFLEALSKGAQLEVRLTLDKFLIDTSGKKGHRFDPPRDSRAAIEPENLPKAINYHSSELLTLEEHFYKLAGAESLERRCAALRDRIAKLPEGSFVIPIGWGIGFRGITGGAISDNDAHELKLPRKDHSHWLSFPITRRAVYPGKGKQVSDLIGWAEFSRKK